MNDWSEKRLPPELEELGARLREARPEATAIELDRIKSRVLMRASRRGSRRRGSFMKSRLATTLVAFGVLAGGAGGVFAAAGGNPGSGSSSSSAPIDQYCPPVPNGGGNSPTKQITKELNKDTRPICKLLK